YFATKPASHGVNKATFSYKGKHGWQTIEARADFYFKHADDTTTNKTVHVVDSRYTPAEPWTVTWPNKGVFVYQMQLTPGGKCQEIENVAKIAETKQRDDEDVKVCRHKPTKTTTTTTTSTTPPTTPPT